MTSEELSEISSRYTYLAVDSRSVFDPANTVFAALRTTVGDGHRFIADLYNRGIRAFIVEKIPEGGPFGAKYYVCDDVAGALSQIAAMRLEGRDGGIIVTGSHGKTTFKELLYQALLPSKEVRCSPRSWNSGIGVPLSVWSMTGPDTTPSCLMITEAGIDGPGQADAIARMLEGSHQIGVITPVDTEHDEAFTSHADKIREKLRLLAGCNTIFYADTDPELPALIAEAFAGRPEVKIVAVSKGSHPSLEHALAYAVTSHLRVPTDNIDSIPLSCKRREISTGSFGNIIYRDRFTPDLRSLTDALDFMRRHSIPAKASALVAGEFIDGTDEAKVRRRAALFGIENVIFLKGDTIAPDILAAYHDGQLLRDSQVLVFGEQTVEPKNALSSFAEILESAGHDTTLEVNLDAIAHNYNHYRRLVPAGTGIVAMVKASAYGMGAEEIGKAMQSLGAAYLAVAVIEEGLSLRDAGITMPVMVLNPVTNRYPALFSRHLEPAVFSPEELDCLIREAEAHGEKAYPVHIKLDTGMHRVGFLENQIAGIAERLRHTDAVRVASVFSHLATADCLDMDSYTTGQLDLYYRLADKLRDELGYDIKRHILNTAGMMRFADYGKYDMARLGIGLYGVSPYEGHDGDALRPVASFRSHIISLKHWPAGTPIGYGCKGRTVETDSIIATVPVGYADGVSRRLGNGHTKFIVRGVECPTIGNICMDLCMVDVSVVPGVEVGDTVEIFGKAMPVERVAEALGTIPYEVFTSVSQRVKRVYVKN